MAAQENVPLVRSLFDLYNNNRSDPAWLDKSLALIAEDCEVSIVPAAITGHGPDGYKQMPSLAAVQKLPTCSLQRIRWPLSLLVGGPTLVHCISLLEISRRQDDHSNCRSAKCSGSREGKSSGTTSTLICSALCNSWALSHHKDRPVRLLCRLIGSIGSLRAPRSQAPLTFSLQSIHAVGLSV